MHLVHTRVDWMTRFHAVTDRRIRKGRANISVSYKSQLLNGAIVEALVKAIKIFVLPIAFRSAGKPSEWLRGLWLHPDWKGADNYRIRFQNKNNVDILLLFLAALNNCTKQSSIYAGFVKGIVMAVFFFFSN